MGIHGLWRLLEPTGRDVTLESLENKVLAIDVSLWLYQAQQGSAYSGGAANAPNSHLLTLFHRISKLLFYRVKPVFVFDGVAPGLKKKTIFARKQKKTAARDRAEEMRQQLMLSLAKTGVVDTTYIKAQADKANAGPSPRKGTPKKGNAAEVEEEDLYKLPPLPKNAVPDKEEAVSEESSLSDEDDNLMSYYEVGEGSSTSGKGDYGTTGKVQGGWKKWNTWVDPHEVDLQSKDFKSLPVEVRREILTDLKEARKESSWGRLHKMPKDLGNFSNFQMSRLLHRRKVQEVLEEVEEELASSEVCGASLGELEAMLVEKGVSVEMQTSQRIASDENKGFILLTGLKDQKKAEEMGDEMKAGPSKLATVKEEPEDIDEVVVKEEYLKKPPFQDVKSEVSGGKGKKELVDERVGLEVDDKVTSRPTSKEVEMLSSSSVVKQFVSSVTEFSDTEESINESSEFENLTNAFDDDESYPDGLSQGEILAIIKSQAPNRCGSCTVKVRSIKVKELYRARSQLQHNFLKEDAIEVVELDTPEEDENDGLTQEQMLKIICDQKGSSVDDEIVEVDEGPTESLESAKAPESVDEIKSNPATPATDVEVKIENVSSDSESDASDFVEVEDTNEQSKPDRGKSCVKSPEPKKEVEKSKPVEISKKTIEDEKLQVVVDLTANASVEDDIFADVFDGEQPKKCEEPEFGVLSDKDTIALVVGKDVKQDEDDKPPKSDGEVAFIEDISASDSDAGSNEEQEKVTEEAGQEIINQPGPSTEVVELTEEERQRMTLELRKKELESRAGVTNRARIESQELLGLFGVPWVVAPYEAEAQCAFLESTTSKSPKKGCSFSRSLVEGTVTEDSDVWAFGASHVYRHVFDRKRMRVRVYSKEEVERKLGIDRIQMIQLALLTGSDYTEGIPGIGTVSALEILAAFPGDKEHHQHSPDPEVEAALSGLQHFADWWRRIERNEKERTPVGHSYYDPPENVAKVLRRRLCSCLKAADAKENGGSLLPLGFPSRTVVQAYLKPSVDDCRDPFMWLKPDEAALRRYARLTFGWTEERIDSILRPLFARLKLSDCVDRKQMSLNSYFSRISVPSNSIDVEGSRLGARTKKALERIAGKGEEAVREVSSPPKKKGRVARKVVKSVDPPAESGERTVGDECQTAGDEYQVAGDENLVTGGEDEVSEGEDQAYRGIGEASEGEDQAAVDEIQAAEGGDHVAGVEYQATGSREQASPVVIQKPSVFQEERIFNDEEFDRRDPSGKLKLMRQKFAKELAKARGHPVTKSRVSSRATSSPLRRTVRNRVRGSKTLVSETGFGSSLYSQAKIPQREKDNASALQRRLKAIEVMRKSSISGGKRAGPGRSNLGRGGKKLKREEVSLSESSDSD
ncbi:DNA excision repair protein ERCC-5 [Hetaerina americana]|uniref:DNA excision repair protein ERCC-5 n=1 Tax=Hetaerina americana TaxID=62018 RepID=UPI003A7F40AD